MKRFTAVLLTVFGISPLAMGEPNCKYSYKDSELKDFPPLKINENDFEPEANYLPLAEGEFNGVHFRFGTGFARSILAAEDPKTGKILAETQADGSPENLDLKYGDHFVTCYQPEDQSGQ